MLLFKHKTEYFIVYYYNYEFSNYLYSKIIIYLLVLLEYKLECVIIFF